MFKHKPAWYMIVLVSVLALGLMGCPAEEEEVEVEEGVDEVATHYEGARIGLVVPEYVDIDSIEELNDHVDEFGGEIEGIDPGAGIMAATEDAIPEYELDYDLVEGSDASMTAELTSAYEEEEWIVVTGWTPHWKFDQFDLKFLEDPDNVYGEAEYIGNIARMGLEEDMPGVYSFLENFYWDDEEIGFVMGEIADGVGELEAAQNFIDEHPDIVDEWTAELPEGEGQEVEIVYVEWECAIASTHTAKAVLQDMGYEVDITPVDAGVMWSSLYDGDNDFAVCAWLPLTHGDYAEEYDLQ